MSTLVGDLSQMFDPTRKTQAFLALMSRLTTPDITSLEFYTQTGWIYLDKVYGIRCRYQEAILSLHQCHLVFLTLTAGIFGRQRRVSSRMGCHLRIGKYVLPDESSPPVHCCALKRLLAYTSDTDNRNV